MTTVYAIEMTTVYAIEIGEYSDYRIERIFSTREKAEVYVDDRNKNLGRYGYGYGIKEYVLDDVGSWQPGLSIWHVVMKRDGTVLGDPYHEGDGDATELRWQGWYGGKNYGDNAICIADVFARDAEHAVKTVNEKRLQAIAEGRYNDE